MYFRKSQTVFCISLCLLDLYIFLKNYLKRGDLKQVSYGQVSGASIIIIRMILLEYYQIIRIYV